jgi:hypothetical protein
VWQIVAPDDSNQGRNLENVIKINNYNEIADDFEKQMAYGFVCDNLPNSKKDVLVVLNKSSLSSGVLWVGIFLFRRLTDENKKNISPENASPSCPADFLLPLHTCWFRQTDRHHSFAGATILNIYR